MVATTFCPNAPGALIPDGMAEALRLATVSFDGSELLRVDLTRGPMQDETAVDPAKVAAELASPELLKICTCDPTSRPVD